MSAANVSGDDVLHFFIDVSNTGMSHFRSSLPFSSGSGDYIDAENLSPPSVSLSFLFSFFFFFLFCFHIFSMAILFIDVLMCLVQRFVWKKKIGMLPLFTGFISFFVSSFFSISLLMFDFRLLRKFYHSGSRKQFRTQPPAPTPRCFV